MSNFGHVEKITISVGSKEYTFRSKLEYRWCVWLQLQKEQDIITDWWYEDEVVELIEPHFGNKKLYLPDFTIQTLDGEHEFHETKGWFPAKDYTKLKLMSEQYDNPLVLIFANLADCKSSRKQYSRAKRLEKHIKRVIYNADRDVFKKIKYLFEF